MTSIKVPKQDQKKEGIEMNESSETAREHYLTEFKRKNTPSSYFGDKAESIGQQIVQLMKKEDLTHDQAYASLQYAYNLIQYQSNFLKLG